MCGICVIVVVGVRGGFDGEMLGYVCVCFSLCGVVYGLGLIVYYCDDVGISISGGRCVCAYVCGKYVE